MSNVAILAPEPRQDGRTLYLGPAQVVAVEGKTVDLALPDGRHVAAGLALAYDYRPRVGDRLLAIGQDDGFWIIGVIDGSGEVKLRFGADVELCSETGSVRVAAAKGVAIDAPELDLRAGKLRILARDAIQRVATLYQSVSDLWTVQAKRSHTTVAESATTVARDCTITTEQQVRINGRAIRLG